MEIPYDPNGSLTVAYKTLMSLYREGIIVPKHYIWPVVSNLYLQPYTSIVMGAHKARFEIFAGGFVKDIVIAYNYYYGYSPIAVQLPSIDNSLFSIDD